VITGVNGRAIADGNDLRNEVAQLMPGSSAKLTVAREGKEQTVTVTVAERQAAERPRNGAPDRR
jgi:S1-C subfamily serine protease